MRIEIAQKWQENFESSRARAWPSYFVYPYLFTANKEISSIINVQIIEQTIEYNSDKGSSSSGSLNLSRWLAY